MATLEILAEAAEEAEAAVDWYERAKPNLGRQFRNAVSTSLELLKEGIVIASLLPRPLTNEANSFH